MIIAIVSDLIFRSKIRESLQQEVRFVKSPEALERELAVDGEKEILVDLHSNGIDTVTAITQCSQNSSVKSVIAFASHVEKDLMEKAQVAGASSVMPRSQFVQWLGDRGSQRGTGTLTLLVFGAIVFAIAYYGYHVIPFFYDYYELENQMQASIRLAQTDKDEVIHKKLARSIKQMGIPADPASMIIRRENNHMDIRLQYREVFYITFRGEDHIIQTFDFDAHARGDF